MKFYGNPNETIIERKYNQFTKKQLNKKLFVFDNNGEFQTEDIKLIEKLKQHFKYENNAIESDKIFKCKKCDFTTNNQGELLAHYRQHKKEGD